MVSLPDPLGGLRTELQLAIIKYLDQSTLRNWSSTCSFDRTLLAPYIFRVLALRNTERSARSADAVARSQNVAHVGEIHCTAADPGDSDYDRDEGEIFPNTPFVFPEIVHKVLSNLDRFPSLHTVSVDFAFDFDAIYWFDSDLMMDVESAGQINEAEETVGWRALMAKTWAAVSENPRPHIKKLQICQLPGRWPPPLIPPVSIICSAR
jgi:hypothetical protein